MKEWRHIKNEDTWKNQRKLLRRYFMSLGKKKINQTNKLMKQGWEILFTTYSEQSWRMARPNVFIVMKRLQSNGSHLTLKNTNKNQGTQDKWKYMRGKTQSNALLRSCQGNRRR